jgi:dihydrofolate reductase
LGYPKIINEQQKESIMRKVVVSEFVSLDGIMSDPGGSDNTPQGGWARKFDQGPEGGQFKYGELFQSDTLLLGRLTYDGFAAAWPDMPDTGDYGERMNSMEKVVVSTTLKKGDWNNSKIISKNVADEVAALKNKSGQNILVFGSGQLVNTLMQYDLVDEYWLMVFPIVLGGGKRLFRDDSQATLKLVESKTLGSGITLVCYQPDRSTK